MRIEYVPLAEIATWDRNPKDHDLPGLAASFERWGMTQPIVRDEATGRLVAGHGRLEVLAEKKANGEDPPARVTTNGKDWLIPVVCGVAFESEHEAEAYLLADNQLSIVGGWKEEELADLLREHAPDGLIGMGWDPSDFLDPDSLPEFPPADTTAGAQESPQGAQEEPEPDHLDNIPAIATPRAKAGEVWALGDHRVMVGDSQDDADVDRLMGKKRPAMVLTDPPFAIYGSSTGIGADIADDKMIRPFFRGLCATIQRLLPRFGHAYIHCDWRSYPTIWWAMNATGLSPKNMIIWDKGDTGLGSSYFHCHELIVFCAKLPPAKAMKSSEKAGQRLVYRPNIMRHGRVTGKDRQHNAAKPVKALIELIQNSSEPGDLVLDLFCGSGSTLIAAERAGRACYTMDLEPKWVDVTIARWEALTGKKAKRLGARTRRRKS